MFSATVTPVTDALLVVIFTVTFALLAPVIYHGFGGALRPFARVLAIYIAAYTICVTWYGALVLTLLQVRDNDRVATSHGPLYGIYLCAAIGMYMGIRAGYALYTRLMDRWPIPRPPRSLRRRTARRLPRKGL